MAQHDPDNGSRIRRARFCGCDHGRDFPEIVRPQDARRDHCQAPGIGGVWIVEAVHHPARDAKNIPRADVDLAPFYRPGEHALQAVDGFFIGVVAVSHRNLRSGSHIELEHRNRAAGLTGFHQKTDGDLPKANLLAELSWHSETSGGARDAGAGGCWHHAMWDRVRGDHLSLHLRQ